jgi:hypothetical protein
VTLSDAQVDRYSRQILLAEVGGRGQARLLDACVAVAGDGAATRLAATLLGRAGVGTLAVTAPVADPGPDCRVVPDDVAADLAVAFTRHGLVAAPATVLVTGGSPPAVLACVGQPCAACADVPAPPGDETDLALGALAAAEALRLLLLSPPVGRRTTLGDGWLTAVALPPTAGCPACAARA